MFGLSFGEVLIILVVALMVLGPSGMPKLARTLGKGLRDFRRATGELRGAFEEEFYQLDQSIETRKPPAGARPVVEAAPEATPAAVVGAAAVAAGRAPESPEEGTGPVEATGPVPAAAGTWGNGVVETAGAAVPDAETTPVVNPPLVKEGREG